MNMKLFHARQGHTYIGAFVVLLAITIPINYLAASGLNLSSWTSQNNFVIAMLLAAIAPLVFRARWVQIAAPIVLIAILAAYMLVFYWVLQ